MDYDFLTADVLACQCPSLFEIHTAFREEMLKPFAGVGLGSGMSCAKKEIVIQIETGVFILEKGISWIKTKARLKYCCGKWI